MYKDFSYIYDKLSFDIDYEFYAENIKTLVSKYKIKKDNMLELACGSGRLTEYFFDEFYHIDAIDLSQTMLEVFSSKFDRKNVDLYNFDMTKFENPDRYDLIVILLDSINYITDKKDLKNLFINCFNNLKAGGLLVFDINSEYKMREIFGNETYVYEYEDIFYTWQNFLEEDLVDMQLNFFVENLDGSYKRIVEEQTERIYSVEFIKELISEIGFLDLEIFDEDRFSNIQDDSLRILFSCKKK